MKSNINTEPLKIWEEYNNMVAYKNAIDLYDNVKYNQNFYLGMQWEGVNAPDIEKPVLNIVKQGVDYFVSMLVSDDIGFSVDLPKELQEETRKALEFIVTEELDKVIENTKFKSVSRTFIKNTALDGDAFLHWWYNTDKKNGSPFVGEIDVELLDNTNVGFGDPSNPDVEMQPYILIIQKLPTNTVKEMAKGSAEDITDDSEDYNQAEIDAKTVGKYTNVITKLWKQDGNVWFMKSTQKVVLVPPTNLKQNLYPIVKMSWKHRKNSYHGVSPITEIRQNQIIINKYYMMLNEFVKKLSFPKILYDMTKIKTWSNKVEALGVNGDPREAIAVSSPQVEMSQQIIQYIENLIEKTKSVLGIYDVALGNVNPQNTSAIIALQKTASQPLELQKMDYFQVVEDSVRIIIDLMASFYGSRPVTFQTELIDNGQLMFNFEDLRQTSFNINVEVGASAYWSEITQIQTLDNMYRAGIIPDPITYLEQLPNGILPNKNEIITAIRNQQQAMMMQQQLAQPQSNTGGSLPQNISQPDFMGGSSMGVTSNNGQNIVQGGMK